MFPKFKLIMMNNKTLNQIYNQVPADYYQKGINKNIFQKIWHKEKLKTVLNLIENNPKSILDVGCASGWFLSEINKKFPKSKCTGIDIYNNVINFGIKKYKSLHLICADAHQLPFKNNSFELVICTEVLEHVVNPKIILKEIERVLAPNGAAIIEMDSGNLLFHLVWYWWNNIRSSVWKDAHIHYFNTKKLQKMLVNNGFSIKKKKIFNFTMAVAFQLEKKKKK